MVKSAVVANWILTRNVIKFQWKSTFTGKVLKIPNVCFLNYFFVPIPSPISVLLTSVSIHFSPCNIFEKFLVGPIFSVPFLSNFILIIRMFVLTCVLCASISFYRVMFCWFVMSILWTVQQSSIIRSGSSPSARFASIPITSSQTQVGPYDRTAEGSPLSNHLVLTWMTRLIPLSSFLADRPISSTVKCTKAGAIGLKQRVELSEFFSSDDHFDADF